MFIERPEEDSRTLLSLIERFLDRVNERAASQSKREKKGGPRVTFFSPFLSRLVGVKPYTVRAGKFLFSLRIKGWTNAKNAEDLLGIFRLPCRFSLHVSELADRPAAPSTNDDVIRLTFQVCFV